MGYGLSSPATQGYPPQTLASLNPNNVLTNEARDGYTSAQTLAEISTVVLPVINSWSTNTHQVKVRAFSVMTGTNDNEQSVSVSTTYANIQSICSSVAATGASVIVFTILPGSTVNETNRQSLNALIIAGGACSYTIADVGSDSTIGQAGQWSNATYYQADGLHPTTAGDAIVAGYLRTALQSLGVN